MGLKFYSEIHFLFFLLLYILTYTKTKIKCRPECFEELRRNLGKHFVQNIKKKKINKKLHTVFTGPEHGLGCVSRGAHVRVERVAKKRQKQLTFSHLSPPDSAAV
jgi:hypothetical protein